MNRVRAPWWVFGVYGAVVFFILSWIKVVVIAVPIILRGEAAWWEAARAPFVAAGIGGTTGLAVGLLRNVFSRFGRHGDVIVGVLGFIVCFFICVFVFAPGAEQLPLGERIAGSLLPTMLLSPFAVVLGGWMGYRLGGEIRQDYAAMREQDDEDQL
jgi:hypothetical protein